MVHCLAIVLAQDYVTVPATIGSAPMVVEALSQASGAKLSVSYALKSEIVGLASPGKSLKASMDALALAVDGKWIERDGGYVLDRPLEMESQRKKRDQSRRLKLLKEAIATQTSQIDTQPMTRERANELLAQFKKASETNPPDYSAVFAITSKTPGEQLVRQLLQSVNPEDILAIPFNGRGVFSSSPGPLQKAFAKDVRASVQSFIGQQNLWSEAYRELPQKSAIEGINFEAREVGEVDKLLFTVAYTQGTNSGSYRLQAKLYDRNGAMLAAPNGSLPAVYLRFTMSEAIKEFSDEDDKAPILPSEDEKLFFGYVNKRRTDRAKTPVFTSETEGILRRPDQRDHLRIAALSALETAATNKRKAIAGILPDSLIFPLTRQLNSRPMTVGKWLAEFSAQRMELIESDSAIAIRPEMPLLNEQLRTDRPAFAKFLMATNAEGNVRLDPTAEFAYRSSPIGYGIGFFNLIANQLPYSNQTLLCLFHTLSENQRQRLKRGDKLGMSEFNPEQRGFLHRLVYHADPYSMPFERATKESVATKGPFGVMGNILMEATESFPNGIPAEATLSLRYDEQMALYGISETSSSYTGRMDAETLAFERLKRQRPELRSEQEKMPQAGKFSARLREGLARDWNFELTLAPDAILRYVLKDDTMTDKTHPFEKLPPALEKQVNDLVEQYRKGFEKGIYAPPKSGPTKVPPPQ